MRTLLITATINAAHFGNVGTSVKDTATRKKEYHDNLIKYLTNSYFDKIIFAENSGGKLDEDKFYELAQKNKKQLEFLFLPVDVGLIKKCGKSYGEAKLIEDAVRRSKLLQGEQAFYKITGRIWIANINELINDRAENCFIAHNFMSWVLTSFFKVRLDDFKELLSDAHMACDDSGKDCIEHVYFNRLQNARHIVNSFSKYPVMIGINSGSGFPYTKSDAQIRRKNILIKFGTYKLDGRKHWYYTYMQLGNVWLHRIMRKL